MAGLQEWIHRLEEGRGARIIQFFTLLLIFAGIGLIYDLRCFKNFNSQEAMDSAQLARRISEGKGYTTDFIRPFSIYLIQKHRADHDPLLKTAHPDLANPPVYPAVLAALMKAAPFKYDIPDTRLKPFLKYTPEMWIAVFNQFLFFIAALILFFLTRRIWNAPAAYLTAIIFVGTELFWRFSISGLSTMLLVVLFLSISWFLTVFDQKQSEESSFAKLFSLAALIGVLVGIGGLTRYSFGLLIIPVVVFLVSFSARHKITLGIVALVSFLVVFSPWLARNYKVSGTLFGTAGYAVFEQTTPLTEDNLQRSLNPQARLNQVGIRDGFYKLVSNGRTIFQVELPKFGGNWVVAFFLVGLLVPLPNKTLSRLRIFLFVSILVLFVAQALGRTQLSSDSPDLNSENLLVVLAPLIFAYGMGTYFILLTQTIEAIPVVRYAVTSFFVLLLCAPLLFLVLPPRTFPLAYPPYYPPIIQETAKWMRENELMMSDVPWATAWYGQRQCAWLTLDFQAEDFFKLNDDMKTVQALYLTPKTTDANFLNAMIKSPKSWPRFVLEIMSKGEVPSGFPLRKSPTGFLPEQVFLTDWERWGNRSAP